MVVSRYVHNTDQYFLSCRFNDLDHSICDICKPVDDTSVANIGNNPSSIDIQLAADEAFGWSSNKEMQLNPSKTKAMLIFQTEYLVFYCELSMLCAY